LLGEKRKTEREVGVRLKGGHSGAQPLIRVENLSSSWSLGGDPCLNNVSLEAAAGQLLGITGPVGSGKVRQQLAEHREIHHDLKNF
jgi:ABC-type multidrug transport system fused ATPase/permease subunit